MPFNAIDVDALCQMAAETDRAILNLITVRERLLLEVAKRVQPGPEIPDWRQFAEAFVREWVHNHPNDLNLDNLLQEINAKNQISVQACGCADFSDQL